MLGRTNASTGNGGISINGDLYNKIVKGADILAGDFVQSYTESPITDDVDDFTNGCYRSYQISDGVYAVYSGEQLQKDSLIIYKATETNFEPVCSLEECYAVTFHGGYIYCREASTPTYLSKFKYEDGVLTRVVKYSVSFTNYTSFGWANNYLVAIYQSSSSERTVTVYSDGGTTLTQKKTAIISQAGNTSSYNAYVCENGTRLLHGVFYSPDAYYMYINIGTDGSISTIKTGIQISGFQPHFYVRNSIIYLMVMYNSSSIKKPVLVPIQTTGSYKAVTTTSDFPATLRSIVGFIRDTYNIVVYFDDDGVYKYTCEYDENNSKLTVINKEGKKDTGLKYVYACSIGDDWILTKPKGTNKNKKEYISEDNITITEGVIRDVVVKYDGSKKTIGIAKNGGSEGDTIEVYLPSV